MSTTPQWLVGVPMEEAARWYCELNCFRWPNGFPLSKPEGWDDAPRRSMRDIKYFSDIFDAIDAHVPPKEQSRAWHTGGYCGVKKTDEEFEVWWASSRLNTNS